MQPAKKTLETPELTDQMIAARANRLSLMAECGPMKSCVYREKDGKS